MNRRKIKEWATRQSWATRQQFCHCATGSDGPDEVERTARKSDREAGKLCPAVELPNQAKLALSGHASVVTGVTDSAMIFYRKLLA
jgi:hypothetical protein